MDPDGKALLIRVYLRESVVQFLWLRLAALRSFAAKALSEKRDFFLLWHGLGTTCENDHKNAKLAIRWVTPRHSCA